MARPLVIGYGNPLRCDDGIGWHVARALADDPRAAGVDVVAAHQLLPEHAEDVARASRVVLVDADVAGALAPGVWTVEPVTPSAGPGAWSHHCTPASLAAMAAALYGAATPVTTVGVGVASTGAGERPTGAVAAAVPSIVELVLRLAGVVSAVEGGCRA